MSINSINVIGIFDRQDIRFNFSRSPLFLVGPNGTGKSTALKILHFILTGQWNRLSDMPFSAVEITIEAETYFIERTDFSRIARLRTLLTRTVRRVPKRGSPLLPRDWASARRILDNRSGPSRNIRQLPSSEIEKLEEDYEILANVSNAVDTESLGRVLYFPTYRRVERDLGELLDHDDSIPFDEEPSIAPAVADRFQSAGEVIGFGGQDIRQLLLQTAASIEVKARQALNEHSVRFLEALATRKTEETKKARALIRSGDRTERLLQRLSNFSPSSLDLAAIRASIDTLRSKLSKANPGRLTQQQDMLLFYVSEMINLIDRIDVLSSPLIRFAEIIDKYMKPVKRVNLRDSDNKVIITDRSENEIELDQLSSGEKQIVAFFAFLLLKASINPRFVIVDEPELSLSVSWQKTLIQDIMAVSPSTFLVAATHSPFIFENFSLDNVESLGEL